jgi:nitrite reductase (NO-forming)
MKRLTSLALAAVLAIAASGCAASAKSSWQTGPTLGTEAVPAIAAASAAAPSAAAQAAGDIEIHAFDLGFEPASVTVPAAGPATVTFVNDGATTHDITFADGTKLVAEAGQTATGEVDIPDSGLTFLCSIPGHAAAGMTGSVSVEGATATPHDTTGGTADNAAPVADPNAPKYTLVDATAPPVMEGKVHDVYFPIVDRDITVAEGFVVKAWTFGGSVPGPTIRVHLGDTVHVHLTNQTAMNHSIDFHASQTAWNRQMVDIKPGETFTYTFEADYAGVWMYHCGTAPTLHHIANGMFGMVIVEPKGGYAKVDKEVALVQSEWYLGAQGEPVDYTKAAAGAPSPDFVVFNGVAAQYKDNPIEVPTKGRVRVFILDAGPNIDSSFHVVGTIFDTVTKEGVRLLPGNSGGWGSQAVDLSPAQAAIIEFSPQEDGLYPLVTHAFNFVGRGAIGLFKAGDGEPNP